MCHLRPQIRASWASTKSGQLQTAYMACITFLYLNGWHVQAPDEEKIVLMLDVATHARSAADIAAWLERHASARE